MITPKLIPAHQSTDTDSWPNGEWSEELRNAVRDVPALLSAVKLRLDQLEQPVDNAADFPLLVPPSFVARMTAGDANDPLLKQVLPTRQERQNQPGFVTDPLAETDVTQGFIKAPGLLQKYQSRVLLITTAGCAINCRYCFRRDFPYRDHRAGDHQQALDAIAEDTSVHEVILSGGDPLLLGDAQLQQLLATIDAIPHVQRIRIHSRIPIVLPQRTTQGLLDALQQRRCHTVMVVHSNHPNELNAQTLRAFTCLKQVGTTLLNQSVLLRGINDDPQVLAKLSIQLFEQGVLPYYLHLTDHVAGTQHFFVGDEEARGIYAQLQGQLPGYLLPKLVREHSGADSKTLMN